MRDDFLACDLEQGKPELQQGCASELTKALCLVVRSSRGAVRDQADEPGFALHGAALDPTTNADAFERIRHLRVDLSRAEDRHGVRRAHGATHETRRAGEGDDPRLQRRGAHVCDQCTPTLKIRWQRQLSRDSLRSSTGAPDRLFTSRVWSHLPSVKTGLQRGHDTEGSARQGALRRPIERSPLRFVLVASSLYAAVIRPGEVVKSTPPPVDKHPGSEDFILSREPKTATLGRSRPHVGCAESPILFLQLTRLGGRRSLRARRVRR